MAVIGPERNAPIGFPGLLSARLIRQQNVDDFDHLGIAVEVIGKPAAAARAMREHLSGMMISLPHLARKWPNLFEPDTQLVQSGKRGVANRLLEQDKA